MARHTKGKALPNTIVVKILDLRKDWIVRVPKVADRDEALKRNGSDWKKFLSFCGPAHVINGRVNMSMDMYFKFIEAAGLDYDTYWDSGANPDDYISKHHVIGKRATANKDTSANSLVDASKKVYVNVKDQKVTPKLPNYPTKTESTVAKPIEPVNVIKNNKLTSSGKPEPKPVVKPQSSAPVNVDTSAAMAVVSTFDQKMNSFRSRLAIYMCALHICSDQMIKDTGIPYVREIRDGKTDLKLYDYIVLSEYIMKKYRACKNVDDKQTFDLIAKAFNDIYVQTLYFADVVKDML